MVLVLLSRFSHPQIDPTLVANLPESSVATLMFFGSISPEDLRDANIVNEIWAVCSSLGRLVGHGESPGALAISDPMKQCVAPKGFALRKEQVHAPGASKPFLVQVKMVGSVLPVQGMSGMSNALLHGHFESLLCGFKSNTKLFRNFLSSHRGVSFGSDQL